MEPGLSVRLARLPIVARYGPYLPAATIWFLIFFMIMEGFFPFLYCTCDPSVGMTMFDVYLLLVEES